MNLKYKNNKICYKTTYFSKLFKIVLRSSDLLDLNQNFNSFFLQNFITKFKKKLFLERNNKHFEGKNK